MCLSAPLHLCHATGHLEEFLGQTEKLQQNLAIVGTLSSSMHSRRAKSRMGAVGPLLTCGGGTGRTMDMWMWHPETWSWAVFLLTQPAGPNSCGGLPVSCAVSFVSYSSDFT